VNCWCTAHASLARQTAHNGYRQVLTGERFALADAVASFPAGDRRLTFHYSARH
jgi:hypothetical protein